MSKQANKTLIGGFVVGAVALIVAGLLVFGSGQFFAEKVKYVVYFEESVKGLNVGAPVLFRGVKIGTVTDIVLQADPVHMSVKIPVFLEADPHRFEILEKGRDFQRDPQKTIKLLVEHGMRARLQTASMVTGQLMVELDFHPDTPIKLVGGDSEVLEIPTIPSPLEELAKAISQLPIEEIFDRLLSAIEGIEGVVNSPEVMESIRSLNQLFKDTGKLVRDVDAQVDPVASSIKDTARDTQKLVRNIDNQVEPIQSSIHDTAKSAASALGQAEKALKAMEDVMDEDSEAMQELTSALKEFSGAARSIRLFADYLQRHPEALIHGKGGSGGR
jgi:paraquat-inducible protein B